MGLLLALLLAQAGGPPSDLPQPPPRFDVDASPTSYACTFTAVLRGEACVYEAEPHAVEDAKSNVDLAAAQAARECAAEADDTAAKDACTKRTAAVARERCTGDGAGLADHEGRLTKTAERCAVALRDAIRAGTGRAIEAATPREPKPAPPVRTPPPAPRKTSLPEKI